MEEDLKSVTFTKYYKGERLNDIDLTLGKFVKWGNDPVSGQYVNQWYDRTVAIVVANDGKVYAVPPSDIVFEDKLTDRPKAEFAMNATRTANGL